MALKIKIQATKGEEHIDPDTMELLMALGSHRNICEQCERFMKTQVGDYCATGKVIIEELLNQPDVTYEPEDNSR